MNKEITRVNIIMEVKRAEALSSWQKLSNEDKIDSFITRADEEVLNWHCLEFSDKRKASITWDIWKERAYEEYSKQYSLYALYLRKQREDETVATFIKDVDRICSELNVKEYDKKK